MPGAPGPVHAACHRLRKGPGLHPVTEASGLPLSGRSQARVPGKRAGARAEVSRCPRVRTPSRREMQTSMIDPARPPYPQSEAIISDATRMESARRPPRPSGSLVASAVTRQIAAIPAISLPRYILCDCPKSCTAVSCSSENVMNPSRGSCWPIDGTSGRERSIDIFQHIRDLFLTAGCR